MTICFESLIKEKGPFTYVDDTIKQSQSKSEMFSNIHKDHELIRKAGLSFSRNNLLFHEKLKFLGHVLSSERIQPIAKWVKNLKNSKMRDCKRNVMKIFECLGFQSCYIKNLQVDRKAFYDLIRVFGTFHWTDEHEKDSQIRKDGISEDTILALPSTDYPFHIHLNSSNVGITCILKQQLPKKKRIMSFNSQVFDKAEQKLSTPNRNHVESFQHCRLTGITSLDLPNQFTCIVTTNPTFTSGDAKDNYCTVSSDTKLK